MVWIWCFKLDEIPGGQSSLLPVGSNFGKAKFRLNKAGDALRFKLNVATIEDVIRAHIHQVPAGKNRPIVVFLFGDPFTDPVIVNGTLAHGTTATTDVIGPIAGHVNALVEAMREENAYVQVHTEDNKTGEIRGQIH